MAGQHSLGKIGEEEALIYLQNKGYHILEHNYRFRKFEIDIIAQSGNTVVAVEVKTRSTDDFGDPQDFVKPAQIKRLVQAFDYYINKNNLDMEARFDVIAILINETGTKIHHIEDAFLHF